MISDSVNSSFLMLTDIAQFYGLTAPSFRKECKIRGIELKGHKQKYSPKEVDRIIEALGVPKTVKEIFVR
jgi:hypothetical protein